MAKTKNLDSKNKLLLSEMKKRKSVCVSKLKKLSDRIKILESYTNSPQSKKVDLKNYLAKKGINYKDFFQPMGYYCGAEKVVSDDGENQKLEYWKGMVYQPVVGYHVPKKNIVTNDDHNKVVKSQLGMVWNPKLNLYFPNARYNSENYAFSEKNADSGMDTMGGLKPDDFGNLHGYNKEGDVFISFVKTLLEEEYDNVSEEFDLIEGSEDMLKKQMGYSSAEGDETPEKLSKKEKRKQDRTERKDTRKEFREGKGDCKERFKKGELSKEDYKQCLRAERGEKKVKLTEQGGTVLARITRGFSTVFPLTIATRGGVLTLIEWNSFGFATRLAPALLPEEEAKQKFTPEAIEKAKLGWKKIKKAWFGLGGKEDNLKGTIIKAYRKRPLKVSKKESFDGEELYEISEIKYSNFALDPATELVVAITSGLGTLGSLLATLTKSGVPKNPYKAGQEPEGFKEGLNELGEDPKSDENTPQLDPQTGKWIEPSSGREIDPLTGKYKDTIFGLNKWVAIALGVGVLAGIYYYTQKKK